MFTTRCGTPIEPRNLIRHFKKVLKDAGLPETIRFHDLRHSCATLLIAQGVHPRVVMEILRHSQISTTMNTYAHVLPRLQRDATAKIEELIGGEASPDAGTDWGVASGVGAGGSEGNADPDAAANRGAPEDAEEGGDSDTGSGG